MGKITIADIAERAGVSKTAVSFAFNNPDRLSETTLTHILKVAGTLGYTPDPLARSLKTKQIGAIGLLVPQPLPAIVQNQFFNEFLEGIGKICTTQGLSLMLIPPLRGSMQRAVGGAVVDGFLTLGLETFRATMKILEQRHMPHVMVDGDPPPNTPSVNIDDAGGAQAVMQHVLAAGHRKIAILGIRTGEHGHYEHYAGTVRRRVEGYTAALAEVGLNLASREIQLIECVSHVQGGYRAFQELWERETHPTAVVAMSDIIAIGALNAARELGVQVPEDLSLVGYDDIPAARWVTPYLTTVHQPIREKGRLAAEMLVQILTDKKVTGEIHRVLPTQLVERASVRNCP